MLLGESLGYIRPRFLCLSGSVLKGLKGQIPQPPRPAQTQTQGLMFICWGMFELVYILNLVTILLHSLYIAHIQMHNLVDFGVIKILFLYILLLNTLLPRL